MMIDYNIEHIRCCVCDGIGKTRQGFFHRLKECIVCRGEGFRPIMIHKSLTPDDAAMVRTSAILGSLNYFRVPSMLDSIIVQLRLW